MSRSTGDRFSQHARIAGSAPLRQDEPLPDADVGARQVVRLLDPPDRVARVAARSAAARSSRACRTA